MERKLQEKIFKGTYLLEIAISVLVIVAIIISLSSLPEQISILIGNRGDIESFREFLGFAFSIVIGVEFLRMLSKHTLSSVIEVLLFAMARALIVEHTTALENLLTIVSITLLFFIRKYLLEKED